MKVKKYIGKSVNGFVIKDSYLKELPSGIKARKVLLECENCGRYFERRSSVDFEHIKCKCMCRPEPKRHKKYEYHGELYSVAELSRLSGISESTIWGRLKKGDTVNQAISGEHLYDLKCEACKKWFTSRHKNTRFCSIACEKVSSRNKKRGKRKKQPLDQLEIRECIVCGDAFIAVQIQHHVCSDECRRNLSRIERSGRYKHLKAIGEYDSSVTLANVYDRDEGVCQGCGKFLTFDCDFRSDEYPSIDHIKPLSKGGSHTWDNVQLLCRRCNSKKGAK